MNPTSRFILFTDLDQLIDGAKAYNLTSERPFIERIEAKGLPVVFTTKRSYSEMLPVFERLGKTYPVVVENGGAIVTSPSYWKQEPPLALHGRRGECFISLGIGSGEVRRRIRKIESEIGESLYGISRMPIEDVAMTTGLDFISVKRAQHRDYSELLCMKRPDDFWNSLQPLFDKHELVCREYRGLRFISSAKTSESAAASMLLDLKKKDDQRTDLMSIAVCSGNPRRELLENSDIGFALIGKDAKITQADVSEGVILVKESGIEGWNQALGGFLKEHSEKLPSQSSAA